MSERYGMARFFEYGCSIDLEQRRAGQLRRQRVAPRAACSAAATLLSLRVVQKNHTKVCARPPQWTDGPSAAQCEYPPSGSNYEPPMNWNEIEVSHPEGGG